MPVQPQLFPEPPVPERPGLDSEAERTGSRTLAVKAAPLWLQRVSLFVLVLFCVYLGVLVAVLPWWPRVWDENLFILARPRLAAFLHVGAVRGVISGLGMLDIWIGVSEAVHYREGRGGR